MLVRFIGQNICYLLIEHWFVYNRDTKGVCGMSTYEIELVRMIREHDEPEKALVIAVEVITSFLKQRGSSEEPAASCPQVPAGTGQ